MKASVQSQGPQGRAEQPSTTSPDPPAEAPGFPGRPPRAQSRPSWTPCRRHGCPAAGGPAAAEAAASPSLPGGDPAVCGASSRETRKARGPRPRQARFRLPGPLSRVRPLLGPRLSFPPAQGARLPAGPHTHSPPPSPQTWPAVMSTWCSAPPTPAADTEARLRGSRRPRSLRAGGAQAARRRLSPARAAHSALGPGAAASREA